MASGNPNAPQPDAESPTALLPTKAFGGKTPEVGHICSFRVVRVYDDQAEVEYVSSESGKYAEDGPVEPDMSPYLE